MLPAKTTGGQWQQALGRSVGGLSTKIHLGCLDEKNAIAIVLTGGEVADVTAACRPPGRNSML